MNPNYHDVKATFLQDSLNLFDVLILYIYNLPSTFNVKTSHLYHISPLGVLPIFRANAGVQRSSNTALSIVLRSRFWPSEV